jgi:DnaJ-class molecular chaperone
VKECRACDTLGTVKDWKVVVRNGKTLTVETEKTCPACNGKGWVAK